MQRFVGVELKGKFVLVLTFLKPMHNSFVRSIFHKLSEDS